MLQRAQSFSWLQLSNVLKFIPALVGVNTYSMLEKVLPSLLSLYIILNCIRISYHILCILVLHSCRHISVLLSCRHLYYIQIIKAIGLLIFISRLFLFYVFVILCAPFCERLPNFLQTLSGCLQFPPEFK